jgi:hypothetical protein
MHNPNPTRQFEPFVIACSARTLGSQLDALKHKALGRIPAQDVDATAPHYTPGLSKAAAQ